MRIITCPDLHGRKEACFNFINKFKTGGFDKAIFLGDYADSWDRTNEDIMDVFRQVVSFKEEYPDKVVLLIGNHDIQYFQGQKSCSGYRPDLAATLTPYLQPSGIRELFQIVHQEGNYLFSHAGIQRKWFIKHLEGLNIACAKYGLPLLGGDDFSALNSLIWTSKDYILEEVGMRRGGMRGDYGGPLWCDRIEMESYGPIHGFNQVVGHTPVQFVERVEKFEGGKRYNNTSVTFTDVLERHDYFLELDI